MKISLVDQIFVQFLKQDQQTYERYEQINDYELIIGNDQFIVWVKKNQGFDLINNLFQKDFKIFDIYYQKNSNNEILEQVQFLDRYNKGWLLNTIQSNIFDVQLIEQQIMIYDKKIVKLFNPDEEFEITRKLKFIQFIQKVNINGKDNYFFIVVQKQIKILQINKSQQIYYNCEIFDYGGFSYIDTIHYLHKNNLILFFQKIRKFIILDINLNFYKQTLYLPQIEKDNHYFTFFKLNDFLFIAELDKNPCIFWLQFQQENTDLQIYQKLLSQQIGNKRQQQQLNNIRQIWCLDLFEGTSILQNFSNLNKLSQQILIRLVLNNFDKIDFNILNESFKIINEDSFKILEICNWIEQYFESKQLIAKVWMELPLFNYQHITFWQQIAQTLQKQEFLDILTTYKKSIF